MSRYPDQILKSVSVLDVNVWPEDEIDRAMFGDQEIMNLAKLVKFDINSQAELLMQFRIYKLKIRPRSCPSLVQKLKNDLSIFPISSAECERGFSAMNRQQSDDRNRLQQDTLRYLLFIEINGPEIRDVQLQKYVISWLQNNGHSALDKATHTAGEPNVQEHRRRIFTTTSRNSLTSDTTE